MASGPCAISTARRGRRGALRACSRRRWRRKAMRPWLRRAAIASALGGALLALWCVRYALADLPLKSSPLQFSINAGSSLRSATNQMVQAGVLKSALPFEILTRLFGDPRNIKPGNYEVERGLTPFELMEKLTRGVNAS